MRVVESVVWGRELELEFELVLAVAVLLVVEWVLEVMLA